MNDTRAISESGKRGTAMEDATERGKREREKKHKHHHHRHRHRDRENDDANVTEFKPQAKTADGKKARDDTNLTGRRAFEEPVHGEDSRASAMNRYSNFLTERRVTQAEMQRRHTWLQRTKMNVAASRDRCRVTHEIRFPETFNGLYCARFAPKGDIIATSFGTGNIQIRSGETGDLRTTLRSGLDTSFPVMCCRFNPIHTEVLYASSACGNIFLCTTNTNEFTRFIVEPKNEVNTIDVNVSGDTIVSGGKDAAVRLYDAETGKNIVTYRRNDVDLLDETVSRFHRMRIFAARYHHDHPEMIVTGGWDDTVHIWDSRVGNGSIRSVKGPHICGDAIDLRGNDILTGSWVVRGSLQVWDMTSTKLIETINPQNRPTTLDGEFLYAVQYFDGDPYGNTVLAGGSGTGAVEVIGLKEKKVLATMPVNKAVVALDSCRTTIVFGGMEAILRVADYS